jgi:hypothetical protein
MSSAVKSQKYHCEQREGVMTLEEMRGKAMQMMMKRFH